MDVSVCVASKRNLQRNNCYKTLDIVLAQSTLVLAGDYQCACVCVCVCGAWHGSHPVCVHSTPQAVNATVTISTLQPCVCILSCLISYYYCYSITL
jgi:hypothetical protein